jgi:50S ribosomal protein L16 3-hydroxylase
MRTSRTGLASLLDGAANTRSFLAESWPNEPFLVHGDPRRLRGLLDVHELRDARTLAAVPCHAILAQGQHLDAQRFGNVAVDGAVAPSLLESGVTLYFNEPHFPSRSLWRWIGALERDLGLAEGVIRPSAFFSSPGRGARMHFDCTESFVVQVRGTKRWTIARNDALPWPPVNYLERAPLPDELKGLVRGPLRAPGPKHRTTIELTAGSVLFLPRGWWHATETTAPSVHLDLLVALPTRADILRPVVDSVLHHAPHWRAPAVGVDARPGEQLAEDLRVALRPTARRRARR